MSLDGEVAHLGQAAFSLANDVVAALASEAFLSGCKAEVVKAAQRAGRYKTLDSGLRVTGGNHCAGSVRRPPVRDRAQPSGKIATEAKLDGKFLVSTSDKHLSN